MAYRILSAAIVACLAGLAVVPASAQTTATSQTHCARDKWTRAYNCRHEYDSRYSNTTTWCTSGRRGRHCETETISKTVPKLGVAPDPAPRPYTPPPQGTVDPALYGGLPDSADPAEVRRQMERGKREEEAARRR
jgi:hypothetical protein